MLVNLAQFERKSPPKKNLATLEFLICENDIYYYFKKGIVCGKQMEKVFEISLALLKVNKLD